MITCQTKRITGNDTEKVTLAFPSLSSMERVVGVFCVNENTQDYGLVQMGLNIGGTEVFPEDFPMKLITFAGNKTFHRHVETRLKRFFDLTPFALKAGGSSVNISLKGNHNYAVDVVLILDNKPSVEQIPSRKYQIIRIAHDLDNTVKKSFQTFSDCRKVTGISLISDQLINEFCYGNFSRFGLKIGGREIFPVEYPANHLLVNSQCVQMDENFYNLRPFDIQASGATAEIIYKHNAPGFCLDPDLICVLELEK